MNNRPLLTIYQAFKKYSNCCPADETIGIRVATKFVRYCLTKSVSFNHELKITELERENEKYKKHIRQLKLKVDDLEEDISTITRKHNKAVDFITKKGHQWS